MQLNRSILVAATIIVTATARAALAQTPEQSADVPSPPPHARWMPSSHIGVGVFAGGGVTDYTETATHDQTDMGGSWTVRVTASSAGAAPPHQLGRGRHDRLRALTAHCDPAAGPWPTIGNTRVANPVAPSSRF